jgi:hypothetical protein
MADNLGANPVRPTSGDWAMHVAKKTVFNRVKETLEKTDTHITFAEDEVYIVWFCFILGGWKALVSTTLPDGRYYEVTYDKVRNRVYIDTYAKIDNREINPDTL